MTTLTQIDSERVNMSYASGDAHVRCTCGSILTIPLDSDRGDEWECEKCCRVYYLGIEVWESDRPATGCEPK
jgi:hypothetical protein